MKQDPVKRKEACSRTDRRALPVCRVDGFTLIELLLSITAVSLIAVMVSGAMRLGYRSVEKGEQKIEALTRLRASLNIIDAQVQSALPLVEEKDGQKKYAFSGDISSLLFSSNYSLWGGVRGYVTVRYTIARDAQGKTSLMVSEKTNGFEATRETRLLQGYDEILFRYYMRDPSKDKGEWVDQWNEDEDLPERLMLVLKQRGKELSFVFPMRARGQLKPLFGEITVKKH